MFCVADGQNAAVRMLTSRPDEDTCDTTACEAVSEEVIARSAVLTSIYEAGGDAMLPGSVTLAALRIWQTSGYLDCNISTGRLCAGYQVADALDDRHIDEWTAQLVDRILASPQSPHDCTASRGNSSDASSVIGSVSAAVAQLPATLQQRLFQAASQRLDSDNSSHRLLHYFCPTLHPSIVLSSISPDRGLTAILPLQQAAVPFFKALSALPATPPPILSLSIIAGRDMWGTTTLTPDAAFPRALAAHTGITALTLGMLDPPFVQCLARALAALTNLRRLQLGDGFDPFYPDALLHLRGRLHHLRSLEDLSITLCRSFTEADDEYDDYGDYYSRYGPGSMDPFTKAWNQMPTLSQLVAPLSALTSLHLDQGGVFIEAPQSVSLPNLCSVSLADGWTVGTAAESILLNVRAPVTYLRLAEAGCGDDCEQFGLPMLAHLPRWRTLRRLDIEIPRIFGTFGRKLWHDKLFTQLPPALAVLPALTQLFIVADSELMLRAVPAAATRLHVLHMACRFPGGEPKTQHAAWSNMYAGLRAPHLTSLSLMWLNNVEAGGMPGVGSLLRACPALQSLTLQKYRCAFCEEEDVAALASLTALQTLTVTGADIPHTLHAPLAAALRPHVALRSLELSDCGLTDALASPLAESGPAWSVLQQLTLGCSKVGEHVAAEVVRGVARLPQFRELTFVAGEWERGADRGKKRHTGADPYEAYYQVGSDARSVESLDLEQDRHRASQLMLGPERARVTDLAGELQVALKWRDGCNA